MGKRIVREECHAARRVAVDSKCVCTQRGLAHLGFMQPSELFGCFQTVSMTTAYFLLEGWPLEMFGEGAE